MTAAAEIQKQALIEAFGESSGSESEPHPSPTPTLRGGAESDTEALGESSDSDDEIEAGAVAQRRALLETFGESSDSDGESMSLNSDGETLSSDSENEALGESSEMESQSLEESSGSESETLGESSDSGDEIEAGAEGQRLALVEAFGESSDSEDEIEAHPSFNCDAESKRRALVEVFGESSNSKKEAVLDLGESSDKEDEAGPSSSSLVCGRALARKRAFKEVSKDFEDEADSSSRGAKARKLALVQAFGETSDSEGEVRSPDQMMELGEEAKSHRWERVEGIKGLWLCRNLLSAKQQSLLMHAIHREGWFEGSDNNQGMRFGDLPEWAIELSRSIREAVCFAEISYEVVGEEMTTEDSCMEKACPLPVDILLREPLFDQLIINVYKPGNMCSCGPSTYFYHFYQGICAHVDLMRFDDGIAIVSLESTCVMHFTQCEQEADASEVHGGDVSPSPRIAVHLTPGSLVVLSGEARYLWKHEINRRPGFQLWEGREIKQEKRTSVTLRKLLQEPDES